MSGREIGWRVASEAKALRRLPATSDFARIDWRQGQWPALLVELAGSAAASLALAAARIADGELMFWQRSVAVDPRALPWLEGPFHAEAAAGAVWASDPKCWWELHRHQHLFSLAAGARLEARPDWARLCLDQVNTWIALHPLSRARAWQSGYEASHRLVAWAWAIPLIEEFVTAEDADSISSAYANTAALVRNRPSRFSSANNHRLAELAGLLGFEAMCGRRQRWNEVWGDFEREVVRQTYEDGGSREQAAGYFLYVLEVIWVAALFALAVGQDLGRVATRAQAMLDWLATIATTDGEPPLIGDDAGDRFIRVDYFADRRAAVVAGRMKALLEGRPSIIPTPLASISEDSKLLPQSGYAVFRGRIGARPARVVFDVGDLGFGNLASHGHADALAILLDVGDETLLRDSGTGSYVAAAGRDRFRATSAHNSVTIDGESQAAALGPHLWGRRFACSIDAAAFDGRADYVRASHDGYQSRRSGAVHARSVTYVKPDVLVVLDRIQAKRSCVAELVWQSMPGQTTEALGSEGALAVAAFPAASASRASGVFSPRYTWIEGAPQAKWRTTGREIVFATAVALGDARVPSVVLRHDGSATAVEVDVGRSIRIVESWAGGAATVDVT